MIEGDAVVKIKRRAKLIPESGKITACNDKRAVVYFGCIRK
jgi:hypothetical protein